MKILMVNKFHYIKGGSETYYFALKKLLESKGHEVVEFSMKSPYNIATLYEKYFIENIDYNIKQSFLNKVILGLKIIYSFEAKRKIEKLILDTKPDIVHLHIFQHQMSPSILSILKKYNLPTVYTAHDLKMLCPNYKMLSKGKACEKCKKSKYYNCLLNSCVKNSYIKSYVNMIEAYLHKWLHSYDAIDTIVTPSEFYRKKFIEFGISADRLVHVPNFLETNEQDVQNRQNNESYFLYFGRLSEEKGIISLIQAMKNVEWKLYIVGRGSLEEEIKEFIIEKNIKNIKILGFRQGQELINIVGNAKCVVIPSEWYENGPYSAIEALKLGRPLIGSDLGGIPELIREGENGYIFEHSNINSLHKTLIKFSQLTYEEIQKMSISSKRIFDSVYTNEKHYDKILKIYKECIFKKVSKFKS